MRVIRWLCLGSLALYVLFTASCDGCRPNQFATFKWRGKVWRILYEKGELINRPLYVIRPGDEYGVPPEDPRLPFTFNMKDRTYEPDLRPSLMRSARAAESAPPYYAYVLSDAPNDAVYILDQQTARIVSTIRLPTLPTGLAISHDGQRVYVGNQEVAAGDPFFPQALPRISVIDKSTRSIIQTINLPTGKRLGKPVVSLDDRLLYVPNQGVFVAPVGFQGASVLIIDTQSRTMVGEIPLNTPGVAINRLVMTPDGSLLYGVQTPGLPTRLFVIDTVLREVVATVSSFISPTDLLMNHTGTRVYVLTADSVVVFDTATNTEIRRQLILQNGRLNSMGLSMDGGSLFVNPELGTSVFRLNSTTLEVLEQLRRGTNSPDSSGIVVLP